MGPVFLRFLCLEDPVLPRADMRSDSHEHTKNTTRSTLTRHGNIENKLKKNAHARNHYDLLSETVEEAYFGR